MGTIETWNNEVPEVLLTSRVNFSPSGVITAKHDQPPPGGEGVSRTRAVDIWGWDHFMRVFVHRADHRERPASTGIISTCSDYQPACQVCPGTASCRWEGQTRDIQPLLVQCWARWEEPHGVPRVTMWIIQIAQDAAVGIGDPHDADLDTATSTWYSKPSLIQVFVDTDNSAFLG